MTTKKIEVFEVWSKDSRGSHHLNTFGTWDAAKAFIMEIRIIEKSVDLPDAQTEDIRKALEAKNKKAREARA